MTINITGAVLASVLFEHSNSICDKEGLLLGKLSNITTDTISDSSLNNVEHQTVYYIHSFLPCEKLFSWYNNRGEVQTEAFNKLLNSCNGQDVIGWYKLRRHSSLSPSLREQAVHKHLDDWMSRHHHPDHRRLIFFLCVSQSTFKGALYTTDHQFMMHDGRKLQNMPVTIMNLGSIAKPHYQTASNFTCSTDSSYSSVVKSLRSSFVNGIDELASVKNVEKLKTSLHDKLKILCERLTKSEADLAKETADMRHLRMQVQSIEGSMASTASRESNVVETHRKKGLLKNSRQKQDEGQMETVTGSELEEEERHLISFDDDADDDDRNSLRPAVDDTKRNEKPHGTTPANHTYLIDENSEALGAIQIDDDDSDTDEEEPTISQQQKLGIKDNKPDHPFDFLADILDTHPVATTSSYALRSQSTLPAVQQDPAGRITRRTRANKPDTMDWETIDKESREPDGIPVQKSKRYVHKVYGRDDD